MAKETTTEEVIRILAAVFLPPLGVFMQVGFRKHFWINVVLTLLGYVPGLIHAVWVVVKFEDQMHPPQRPALEERPPPPGPPPVTTARPHEAS